MTEFSCISINVRFTLWFAADNVIFQLTSVRSSHQAKKGFNHFKKGHNYSAFLLAAFLAVVGNFTVLATSSKNCLLVTIKPTDVAKDIIAST